MHEPADSGRTVGIGATGRGGAPPPGVGGGAPDVSVRFWGGRGVPGAAGPDQRAPIRGL